MTSYAVGTLSLRRILQQVERGLIAHALDVAHGNVTHTAKDLGISRAGLKAKLVEHGMNRAAPKRKT